MTRVTLESRRERRKRETRTRIVEAATELFSEHGFDAPTIDQIAASADVGKGTIYNYFQTKEAILFEFLVEIERRTQRRLARFMEAPGPLEKILGDWLRYQFRLKRPYLPFVRVFLSQLVLRAGEFHEHIERIQLQTEPPASALLERLQQRGLIPDGADLNRIRLELTCMHFGLSCLWAMEGPPFRMTMGALETQTSAFCQAIERGLL